MSETVAMLPSASRQPLVPLCCCQPRQTDNAMSETVAMLPSASRQPLCHCVAVSLVRRTMSCPRQWLCCHQPRNGHRVTVLLSASSDGQCHVRDSSYVAIISFETVTVLLSASSDGQCLIPDDHPVAKSLMRTPHIQKPVQTRPAVVHHDLSS